MKVYLPNDSTMGIGGGWTFRRNLIKATEHQPFEIVDSAQECDVALVCGATMVMRETWQQLTTLPCKVVLRVDGVPEDWRNRGSGWPRLRDFAKEADAVVHQSQFVRRTVGRLIGRNGRVIVNGCDLTVFKAGGDKLPRFGSPSVLCVNYRKDENKRVVETVVRFREFKLDNSGATLTFVGRVPNYLAQHNYGLLDLVRDRDWRMLNVFNDSRTMARVMRSHDSISFPSFADPCPNTLIEALCCGCKPLWICPYGGASEIVDMFVARSVDFWSLGRMGKEYCELFRHVLGES